MRGRRREVLDDLDDLDDLGQRNRALTARRDSSLDG